MKSEVRVLLRALAHLALRFAVDCYWVIRISSPDSGRCQWVGYHGGNLWHSGGHLFSLRLPRRLRKKAAVLDLALHFGCCAHLLRQNSSRFPGKALAVQCTSVRVRLVWDSHASRQCLPCAARLTS